MCPILHFACIAFAHNVFHPRLVAAVLTLYTLHDFSSPGGRITIDYTFKDYLLEVPIFRGLARSIDST